MFHHLLPLAHVRKQNKVKVSGGSSSHSGVDCDGERLIFQHASKVIQLTLAVFISILTKYLYVFFCPPNEPTSLGLACLSGSSEIR